MLRSLLSNYSLPQALILFLLMLPVSLLSLSIHELCHGYAANKMGDPTAKMMGRLTLDPLKHLDPIGFLFMIFVGYGWARPVPVNPRNFDNYKKGMRIVSLAGPLSNFCLMVLALLLYRIFVQIFLPEIAGFTLIHIGNILLTLIANSAVLTEIMPLPSALVCIFFYFFVIGNAGLCLFNLIPIPPFDGSKLLTTFLPPKGQLFFARNQRTMSLIFIIALFLGLVSGPLSIAISFIVSLVDKLFLLIPFFG